MPATQPPLHFPSNRYNALTLFAIATIALAGIILLATKTSRTVTKKLFEKSSLVHCEAGEHAADLAEMHHRFSGIGSTLVIFAEAAVMVQPCKCSFDDPTL